MFGSPNIVTAGSGPMRSALILSAGLWLAAIAGAGSASAAPGITPGVRLAGQDIEQVRMGRRSYTRRGGRKVMGLPTPGTRGRPSRTRLPRL